MKTFSFKSLIAVILASALQTRAEQSVNEDHIVRAATQVEIADPSLAKNYFVNYTNYESSQGFSLVTNIADFVDTNVCTNRIGIYTSGPENLNSRQALIKSTPYVWLAVKPKETKLGGVVSRNRSDYIFSPIDVEFWPFMREQIQNDPEYYARIATSRPPVDQFKAERLFDGEPGYSTMEPEVGFSWLSRKMGAELSIFSGLTLDRENTTIDYRSGDAFHVDATMASYMALLGGSAGIGVNGYYLKRLPDDSDSIKRLGSSKMRANGIGPVIFYVRNIGKDQFTFEAKWSPMVNIRNTTIGNFFRIEFALIF